MSKLQLVVWYFICLSDALYADTLFTALPKAIIVVPVADVLNRSISTLFPKQNIKEVYHATAFFEPRYAEKETVQFERVYQLLYNETVGIIKEEKKEIMVTIPHIYCDECVKIEPRLGCGATYWLLKEDVIFVDELCDKKIDLNLFPEPINYHFNNIEQANKKTITLMWPYEEPVTNAVFSAGTRFVLAGKDEKSFLVWVFIPFLGRHKKMAIPKEFFASKVYSPAEKIKQFVYLIAQWANLNSGFIPYVWGGASFSWPAKGINTFHSVQWNIKKPYCGFDCSCLISRAAQICGIPYFLGDTNTIYKQLPPLTKDEYLQAGDLIWFSGHIIIVGSLEKNTIFEARGYGAGFGRVHEIPLNKLFAKIGSFTELEKAFFDKKKLYLLHKNGTIRMIISEFKLMKLSSVWNWKAP